MAVAAAVSSFLDEDQMMRLFFFVVVLHLMDCESSFVRFGALGRCIIASARKN